MNEGISTNVKRLKSSSLLLFTFRLLQEPQRGILMPTYLEWTEIIDKFCLKSFLAWLKKLLLGDIVNCVSFQCQNVHTLSTLRHITLQHK